MIPLLLGSLYAGSVANALYLRRSRVMPNDVPIGPSAGLPGFVHESFASSLLQAVLWPIEKIPFPGFTG